MSSTPTINNPLDQPWEDVTISLVYRDGNTVQTRPARAIRAEVEADDRAKYIAQAEAMGDEQAIEAAASYELTPEEFERRITANVERMVVSPLFLKGKQPHEFRLLPPWAILEIVVTVNNAAPRIVTS